MNLPSFVVVTPSRGLVHSRTIEAVLANVEQAVAAGHVSHGWRLTHDLPIPDCHERVTELGLATGADALWLLEEDMIPPPDALVASLALLDPASIVAMDYPLGERPCMNCLPRTDPLEWCGLGCTLIVRRVFESLERPWFRTDEQTFLGGRVKAPYFYAGLDSEFGLRATSAGFRIARAPGVAGHALLLSWGRYMAQDGRHEIEVRDKIERYW